ncbi:GGDEF domain-containing protein [Bacillus thuringiensis]|uniref:GGDEF domain-containing protein n=3 Tax=Bacillus cereus group TaxID=86661 RepID=A0A9X6U2T4_BACTU|nr:MULTISPECIES: diguanylate cyclase [Bacillus]EJS48549.1 diguanylate cyclase (GGDEF) domain-containing protein [Bacillus cereus BAG1X1-2]EJV86431.1 diguanylate cyclase (GGDEF) domain-containing protein [Bacillus cereus HuB1-1]EPF09743.1 diguanylate cyclase (GGDEF) domain-containing protein [Bacillus cereus BAG1O-3]KAB2452631.1 diguanylate cyclase [Bacillus cereus]KAB2487544.1 diguanylate cyclase [Bacillus cereus]
MLRDLFVNTTIIISFIFVGGQLLRDKPLKEGFSFLQKCVIGIFTGILGVLLMHFGVHIEDIMLDLRYLAVILAIIVGGPVASSITVTIILITRLIFTEYSLASELACYTILLSGIGVIFIARIQTSITLKLVWLHVYCLSILIVPMYILFNDISVVVLYLISSITTGYITFVSTNYVLQSNELFQKMKQYATIDALTGLGNVRQFDLEMNCHISNKNMKNDSLCLLLIDIDHFKYVNDTYGHPAGDEVLKQVGCILRETSQFPDLAFRKGGEEFALLIPNKGLAYGICMGEQIRTAVESHPFQLLDGTKIKITVSVGVSEYEGSSEQFIQAADDALYYSKRNGRNKVSSAS